MRDETTTNEENRQRKWGLFCLLGKNGGRPDLRDFPLVSTQVNHAGQAVHLFPKHPAFIKRSFVPVRDTVIYTDVATSAPVPEPLQGQPQTY